MADIETYLEAATRASTKRTYAGAVRHFEIEAGRPLPATGEQIAQYLADYAGQLAVPTLRHRLAAIAQWHRDQGFPDPTKVPVVRKAFKGIRVLHASLEKQAKPLHLTQLGQVADWLEAAASTAKERGDNAAWLHHLRDRALVLLGFWRAFRGDELLRLQAEHVQIDPGKGMTCFLPYSKGDRQNLGKTYRVPALSRWCPVQATTDWISAAQLTGGPLLRPINRWGRLAATGLHANSFIPVLRDIFAKAGLPGPTGYSGHSLRRGFAGWAESQGWDIKTLMAYVGWRDVHSAMRYLEPDPFAQARIDASLPGLPALSTALPAPDAPFEAATVILTIELSLLLTGFTARSRGAATARTLMEGTCLARFRAVRMFADGSRYRLRVPAMTDPAIDAAMGELLEALYTIADNHRCSLEASLYEPASGRSWD